MKINMKIWTIEWVLMTLEIWISVEQSEVSIVFQLLLRAKSV